MLTQTNAIVDIPANAPTCERCTYNGPTFFHTDNGEHLCGRCMDREDDSAMPHLTSEYAWQLLKAMDD